MLHITRNHSRITRKNLGEASKMSPAIEAQDLIREIAGQMPAGSQIQQMLTIAARETRLDFQRIKNFWQRRARIIRSDEMDALRDAAKRRRRAQEARDRESYQELVERMAVMEMRLAALSAQLPGAEADRAGSGVAGGSRYDRSVGGA